MTVDAFDHRQMAVTLYQGLLVRLFVFLARQQSPQLLARICLQPQAKNDERSLPLLWMNSRLHNESET